MLANFLCFLLAHQILNDLILSHNLLLLFFNLLLSWIWMSKGCYIWVDAWIQKELRSVCLWCIFYVVKISPSTLINLLKDSLHPHVFLNHSLGTLAHRHTLSSLYLLWSVMLPWPLSSSLAVTIGVFSSLMRYMAALLCLWYLLSIWIACIWCLLVARGGSCFLCLIFTLNMILLHFLKNSVEISLKAFEEDRMFHLRHVVFVVYRDVYRVLKGITEEHALFHKRLPITRTSWMGIVLIRIFRNICPIFLILWENNHLRIIRKRPNNLEKIMLTDKPLVPNIQYLKH